MCRLGPSGAAVIVTASLRWLKMCSGASDPHCQAVPGDMRPRLSCPVFSRDAEDSLKFSSLELSLQLLPHSSNHLLALQSEGHLKVNMPRAAHPPTPAQLTGIHISTAHRRIPSVAQKKTPWKRTQTIQKETTKPQKEKVGNKEETQNQLENKV